MDVDYRTLLKKYITHVQDCEGIDFISEDWAPQGFTVGEWLELIKLSAESWTEYDQKEGQ